MEKGDELFTVEEITPLLTHSCPPSVKQRLPQGLIDKEENGFQSAYRTCRYRCGCRQTVWLAVRRPMILDRQIVGFLLQPFWTPSLPRSRRVSQKERFWPDA